MFWFGYMLGQSALGLGRLAWQAPIVTIELVLLLTIMLGVVPGPGAHAPWPLKIAE